MQQGVHHPTFRAGPRCSQPAVEARLPVRIGLVSSGVVVTHADAFRDIEGGFHGVGHEGSRRSLKFSNHAGWQLFLFVPGGCSWSIERWSLVAEGFGDRECTASRAALVTVE